MNAEELAGIIESLGGAASVEEICRVYQRKWGMYIDPSFKSGISQILNAGKGLVRYNGATGKWELGPSAPNAVKYLYVGDQRTFPKIDDVMREVFGFKKVKIRTGWFNLEGDLAAWFPQYGNKDWDNRLSEDGRYWYERPRDGHMTEFDTRRRYVFEHNGDYRFTGLFRQVEIRDDATRVYEIIDDKGVMERFGVLD